MRCSQPMGLPRAANEFIYQHAKLVDECQHCHRHSGHEVAEIGSYGMFGELKLHRYLLKDGRTADEFVQYCEHWSGPMEWLGLRVSDGSEFLWTAEEIAPETYTGATGGGLERAIAQVRDQLAGRPLDNEEVAE